MTPAAPPVRSILGQIGNTPMAEVMRIDTGRCRLFVKLENQNPGGSIKDRIGLAMIEAAERDGRLQPGGTIIEATAGNTGLGLALVSAQKGYRLILVVPDKMSREKIQHLEALGAEVRITRSNVVRGHPAYYQDMTARLEREIAGAFWVNQFANPNNPRAHEQGTGPEIWAQMDGALDAVVVGVGSGGTLTGLGRYFKRVAPDVRTVLADPKGSVLADLVKSGRMGTAGAWLVEGIGEDFVPDNCDLALVAEAYTIDDAEAFATARELLLREGIFGGSSTGTLVAAALRYCRAQASPKRVVTLAPDSGNKYISKMYNDYWMIDQGFLARETHGDLRDLIGRPAAEGAVVSVEPGDSLLFAHARMQLYDLGQLPVLEKDRLVGIIDESDLLLAIYRHEDNFKAPVRDFMTQRLEVVGPGDPLDTVISILRADRVAIVVDRDAFLGLVTKTDLLAYLRRKVR
ncbi:MAG: pyridoxal-phosphate dependent enzyme [Alphaproteobacteria bacterium]|nr:pyridoxal-phosphate dependent enzyme [Alphaproteobacteria bacterium]